MSEEIVGPETIKRIQLLRVSHDLKPYDLGNVTIAVASAYIECTQRSGTSVSYIYGWTELLSDFTLCMHF